MYAEILSLIHICTLRLCLAVVFFGIFERYGVGEYRTVLVLLILAAAATDVLDGRIARSFNSISQDVYKRQVCDDPNSGATEPQPGSKRKVKRISAGLQK